MSEYASGSGGYQSPTVAVFGGEHLQLRLERRSRWGLSTYTSPVLYPVQQLDTHNGSEGRAALNALLGTLPRQSYIAFTAELSADALVPFQRAGFTLQPRLSYRLSLADPAGIGRSFSRNRRRNLRAAERAGGHYAPVAGEIAHRQFDELLKDRGSHLPLRPARFVEQLTRQPQRYMLRGVFLPGETAPRASLLVARCGPVAYALFNARREGDAGALTLLYRQAMRELSGQGVEQFDFNGSMLPGVAPFLRSFGGEPHVRYYAQRIPGGRWGRALYGLVRGR